MSRVLPGELADSPGTAVGWSVIVIAKVMSRGNIVSVVYLDLVPAWLLIVTVPVLSKEAIPMSAA